MTACCVEASRAELNRPVSIMGKEIEFHISRSHGFVGLQWETKEGKLTLVGVVEPCLAAYLGLVEVGDVLLSIDGNPVACEADLVAPPEEAGSSYSKDDMCLKIERFGKSTQHDIEGEDIKRARALVKATSKTDHAAQAKLQLSMGEVMLARGDYVEAEDTIDNGLNIAYGINVGKNVLVVKALCSLSQVRYCMGNYETASKDLVTAEETLKQLGVTLETLVLELEVVNKKAEVATCLQQDDEMLKLKARAAEIFKVILSLQVYSWNVLALCVKRISFILVFCYLGRYSVGGKHGVFL